MVQAGTMTAISEGRDEGQIIASILAGNTHEFHELIRPHERSVYAMALSMLHNEADAEDVAQEAFLKAFRNLAKFRGEAKFSTWLISIVLNEARGRLRSKSNVKLESLDEPPDGQQQITPALLRDWREIPSEALERKETRQLLQQRDHRSSTDLPRGIRVARCRGAKRKRIGRSARHHRRVRQGSAASRAHHVAEETGSAVEASQSEAEVVPMVIECRHVWEHISDYLDGRSRQRCSRRCSNIWSTAKSARPFSTPRETS